MLEEEKKRLEDEEEACRMEEVKKKEIKNLADCQISNLNSSCSDHVLVF